MNFNQRPHQLQKIKRPKFYGARKPAYLNLALQHCPTSYWSSPDFWRKTIEKKLKYNIEEKQDEYETVKKSGEASFALVVKDWDCLWKWTQQQQLLFHF